MHWIFKAGNSGPARRTRNEAGYTYASVLVVLVLVAVSFFLSAFLKYWLVMFHFRTFCTLVWRAVRNVTAAVITVNITSQKIVRPLVLGTAQRYAEETLLYLCMGEVSECSINN